MNIENISPKAKKRKISKSALMDCTNKLSNALDNTYDENFDTSFCESFKKCHKLVNKKHLKKKELPNAQLHET